ncbi:MAG: hypothetical protein V8S32_06725 [Lachnospiraceae bacterium]
MPPRSQQILPISRVILDHHADCIQDDAGSLIVCVEKHAFQALQELIRLSRLLRQDQRSQILRNIFGEFILSKLQSFQQLHSDLIALVGAQAAGKEQKRLSSLTADITAFADGQKDWPDASSYAPADC